MTIKTMKTMKENINGQTLVRSWYMDEFPTDELGKDINGGCTFQNVYEALAVGFDIYALIGVGDSIVRERIFQRLADLMDTDYADVYEQWRDADIMPLGYLTVEDMRGLRFNGTWR